MSEKPIERLYDALKDGPTQPWERDASAADAPEVGRAVCVGCLARKMRHELQHLKPYRHTCIEGARDA